MEIGLHAVTSSHVADAASRVMALLLLWFLASGELATGRLFCSHPGKENAPAPNSVPRMRMGIACKTAMSLLDDVGETRILLRHAHNLLPWAEPESFYCTIRSRDAAAITGSVGRNSEARGFSQPC